MRVLRRPGFREFAFYPGSAIPSPPLRSADLPRDRTAPTAEAVGLPFEGSLGLDRLSRTAAPMTTPQKSPATNRIVLEIIAPDGYAVFANLSRHQEVGKGKTDRRAGQCREH